MPTKFVPTEEFDTDLVTHKQTILDFVKTFYTDNKKGPSQEEIRDGVEMDNDMVSIILKIMVDEGTIKKIQA